MDACPIKRLIICKVTPLCHAITANECLARWEIIDEASGYRMVS